MQSPSELASPSQRRLLEELERAFGGDQGARIFVQAALRAARLSALPRESGPLMDFVRAHLLAAVAGELGPRETAELLARLTAAMESLSVASAYESGVRPREDDESLPSVDVELSLQSTLPPSAEAPPRSARSVRRLRVALVHGDRFGRVSLARHLLQGYCDVVVVDSFAELAAVDGEFPTIAVVHLAARDVELLLSGIIARNPAATVLAIPPADDRVGAELVLTKAGVRNWQLVDPTTRPLELAVLVRRLAG